MTTDLPDLPSLLALCAQATTEAEEAHKTRQADADAEHLLFVRSAAVSSFGPEAAASFGHWQPVESPQADTLQMFARLTDTVYLRYTAELGRAQQWFHLVVCCDACLSSRETRVSDLVNLAAALTAAGVR